jgi:hypothetical protein
MEGETDTVGGSTRNSVMLRVSRIDGDRLGDGDLVATAGVLAIGGDNHRGGYPEGI